MYFITSQSRSPKEEFYICDICKVIDVYIIRRIILCRCGNKRKVEVLTRNQISDKYKDYKLRF